ncbi:antirestriction protein ArdA [Alteromonas macleodii]|uniref:antirestriction protein ArdA n=1 Tax=Alteromonas macleodii TaxID=28108 RepID=UPI0039F17F00
MDDIQEQINDMLASSPEEDAEEYAIRDDEGFAGYSISEYEGIQRAHEVAYFLESLS